MKYTLDRFEAKRKPPDTVEGEIAQAGEAASQLSSMSGRLGRVLDKLDKKRQANTQAKVAIAKLLVAARSVQEETQEDTDVMGRLLGRMLKFVGRKVMRAIVRPIIQFAAQVARNAIKIAARTALRFIVWPAIQVVGGALTAALATPVGWIVLGGAAVLGGAYWLLKGRAPEVVEIEDTTPTGAVVDEAAPESMQSRTSLSEVEAVDVELSGQEVPKSKIEQLIDNVRHSSPVQAIERAVERPKVFVPKKGSKFKGFGDEVDGYIREASARYPILKEDVLRGFIKMEAGWTGDMSPTGAIGTGQFTAGTWNRLITRGGAAIGMTPITGIYGEEKDARGRTLRPRIKPNPKGNFRTEQDPRFNRRVNTLATGLLAAGNAKMLERAGLPVTGANLYMMHNIGPGIIPVMQGKPASAATLKAMQQNGMTGKIKTAQDFLQYQKGRFDLAYQDANTSTSMGADLPKMANGTTVDKPRALTKQTTEAQSRTAAAPAVGLPGDLVRGPNNTIVRM